MKTSGRNELMQSKAIEEGNKTVHVCKTIYATSKGNNECPRP